MFFSMVLISKLNSIFSLQLLILQFENGFFKWLFQLFKLGQFLLTYQYNYQLNLWIDGSTSKFFHWVNEFDLYQVVCGIIRLDYVYFAM